MTLAIFKVNKKEIRTTSFWYCISNTHVEEFKNYRTCSSKTLQNQTFEAKYFWKFENSIKPSKKDFFKKWNHQKNLSIVPTDINVNCSTIGKAMNFLCFSYETTCKGETTKDFVPFSSAKTLDSDETEDLSKISFIKELHLPKNCKTKPLKPNIFGNLRISLSNQRKVFKEIHPIKRTCLLSLLK